jgi:hypothetical protein
VTLSRFAGFRVRFRSVVAISRALQRGLAGRKNRSQAPERALLIEAHMKVDHEIKVFQEHSGVAKWHNEWRVEYTDTKGGSYVTIFAGPQAEQRARDYQNALVMGALDAIPRAKR